jgi:hypothetical protein
MSAKAPILIIKKKAGTAGTTAARGKSLTRIL